MHSIFVFLVLIACASCALNPPNCGKAPNPADRIRGGTVSQAKDWPWQVSLRAYRRHMCGGSLINDRWIVTAAHCVSDNLNPNSYEMQLGNLDSLTVETGSIVVPLSKIIIHPNYNPFTLNYDIALIQLASPVQFTEYIQPVCVETETKVLTDIVGWATGWGASGKGSPGQRYRMQVQMTVLPHAQCPKWKPVYDLFQICAGKNTEGSTCYGDSGGPFVIYDSTTKTWELVGLTSFGRDCIDDAVFTRLSAFKDWMLQTMKQN